MKLFSLILCCLFALSGFCQNVKYEKESRIKVAEVPKPALSFVQELGFDSKIKWYREQNLDQTSIEAKTKYQGKRYSIEFSEKGEIEDVEIIIDEDDIPAATWKAIEDYLVENYDRTKLCKAQIQYTGKATELMAKIKSDRALPSSQIKYELIVKTKANRQKRLMEFLFDAQGKLERSDEIIFRNTDNLDY